MGADVQEFNSSQGIAQPRVIEESIISREWMRERQSLYVYIPRIVRAGQIPFRNFIESSRDRL